MPRNRRRFAPIAAVAPFILLLAFAGPTGAVGTELVTNGTFDTNLSGWTVPSSGGCGNTTWNSAGNPGGSAWMNACGEAGSDPSIHQVLGGLSVGTTYTLRGEYRSVASSFGNPAKPDAFEVELDGTVILSLGRPSPTATTWTAFSVEFTATGTSHKIEFFAERDGDDSDFAIDNISVMAEAGPSPTEEPTGTDSPTDSPTDTPAPTDQVTPPPTDLAAGSRGGDSVQPILPVLAVLAGLMLAATLTRRPAGRRVQ